MYTRFVRNKKTNEVGKLIHKQQKYFTVLVEWKNGRKYHKEDDVEILDKGYINIEGVNGID